MTAHSPQAPRLSRREFALGTGTLTLAGLTGCLSSSARPTGIIDTHTHFYDPQRPQGVPWPGRDDAFLYRTVLPPEYAAFARPAGVTGTIVVEASPWEEDNQWVLDLAAREPLIVGLVGHLKPGRPGFVDHLQRFARHRRFLGIRSGLWDVAVEPEREAYLKDLRHLAGRGLALDVLIGPERLPLVDQLATALPDLRIIINHVANVRIDGQAPPPAWVSGMRACARHPNVACKVSALVEGTGNSRGDAPGAVDFYRPVLDVVWEAFGEDRLIYGSNWPVSARFAPYERVQSIVSDYFQGKGASATAKYFHGNARHFYRYVV